MIAFILHKKAQTQKKPESSKCLILRMLYNDTLHITKDKLWGNKGFAACITSMQDNILSI